MGWDGDPNGNIPLLYTHTGSSRSKQYPSQVPYLHTCRVEIHCGAMGIWRHVYYAYLPDLPSRMA